MRETGPGEVSHSVGEASSCQPVLGPSLALSWSSIGTVVCSIEKWGYFYSPASLFVLMVLGEVDVVGVVCV